MPFGTRGGFQEVREFALNDHSWDRVIHLHTDTNSESSLPKPKDDEQEERRNGGGDKTVAREKTSKLSCLPSLFLLFSVPPVNSFFSYIRHV